MITRLFLNNEEVELDNKVDFTINKAFEDITDPTTIINEWSKTVNIPFTNRNNQLFGSIFSIDRQILTGGSHPTGIYFDPTKKADFKLLYNNSLIMSGYCKLTTVTVKNSGSYYNINLFGQLGNIFHELQQLSFNPDLTDPSNVKYTIGKKVGDTYQPYVDEFITKDLVKEAWTTEPTNFGLEGCKWNDIIGFACCNQGFNSDFDSNTIQITEDSNETAAKVLENHYSSTGVVPKVSAEAAVGDGLLPRQFGEYRSYYQTPYIYVNKMFQMLQAKCKELTDYEVVLDPNWFNPQNPYYSKLVMMLNNFAEDNGNEALNSYPFTTSEDYRWTTYTNPITFTPYIPETTENQHRFDFTNQTLTIKTSDLDILSGAVEFQLYGTIGGASPTMYFNQGNALYVDVVLTGESGEQVKSRTLIFRDNTTLNPDDYEHDGEIKITSPSTHFSDGTSGWRFPISIPTVSLTNRQLGETATIKIEAHFVNNENPFGAGTAPTIVNGRINTGSFQLEIKFNVLRSYVGFSLDLIWDENTTFFDCILNYCKTYGIIFKVDEVNKQLLLLHRTTYFKDFTIEDWSDKLDRTQEFIISPITFDTKYVSFNYEDNGTDYGKTYSKRYSTNYGGLKLKTLYEFNTENTDLFKNLKTSLVNTGMVLSWNNLLNNDVTYFQTGETMPYFAEGTDTVDSFGTFYLYKGLHSFDPELGTVRITDDTDFQADNQQYSYLQAGIVPECETEVTTYPYLDIFDGKNLCLFSNPLETYDVNQTYLSKNSIYTNFWKDWMDEQYNVQNKKISCYLNIHPIDYLKFDFKHFIMIENQLYLLNKIEDYDITKPDTTKCELIGIQDTNAYTTIPFGGDYLAVSDYTVVLGGGESKKIKIYSNNGFVIGSYGQFALEVTPSESSKKETEVTITSHAYPIEDTYIKLPVKSGDLTQNILIIIKKSVINGNS